MNYQTLAEQDERVQDAMRQLTDAGAPVPAYTIPDDVETLDRAVGWILGLLQDALIRYRATQATSGAGRVLRVIAAVAPRFALWLLRNKKAR